ncbi:hypothetical protein [Pseudomonas sp. LB3P14]
MGGDDLLCQHELPGCQLAIGISAVRPATNVTTQHMITGSEKNVVKEQLVPCARRVEGRQQGTGEMMEGFVLATLIVFETVKAPDSIFLPKIIKG